MKKAVLIVGCISLAVITAFSLPKTAKATTVVLDPTFYQPYNSQTETNTSQNYEILQEIGYSGYPVLTVKTYFDSNYIAANHRVVIYACPNNNYSSCLAAGSGGTYIHLPVEGYVTPSAVKSLYTWNYTDVPAGSYILLVIQPARGNAVTQHTYGSNVNVFTPGACKKWDGSNYVACTTLSDIYFEVYTDNPLYNIGSIVNNPFQSTSSTVVTSTSITARCPDLGMIVTPLCDFAMWAVVPDLNSASSSFYRQKAALMQKAPFSYIATIGALWTQNSTTGTSPNITLNTAGYAPTTSTFGTFAPASITLFSASTVQSYVTPTTWTLLKLLFGYSFMTASLFYVYFQIVRFFR